MSQELLDTTESSVGGRVIEFETAEVVSGIVPDTYFLIVSGQAPCFNMAVSLIPLIYVSCPEYWTIEVVGTLPGGFCLPTIRPYVATIPLNGVIGSKGIEVVGSTSKRKFDLSGGCS